MVSIGHANDGGGSIRIPASCCGLVGLKATRARVSMAPLGDVIGGLATELVVSRSVRDSAAVLEFVSEGAPPGEPYFAPAKRRALHRGGRRRPGQAADRPDDDHARRPRRAGHPDCVAAAESAARTLEALGHSVEVAHPPALDDPSYIAAVPGALDGRRGRRADFWSMRTGKQITQDDVEPLTWALAEQGWSNSAAQLRHARSATRRSWRARCWPGGRTTTCC